MRILVVRLSWLYKSPPVRWHLGTYSTAVIFVLSVGGICIEFLPCQMLHIVSFHHVTIFPSFLQCHLCLMGQWGIYLRVSFLGPVNQNKKAWRLRVTVSIVVASGRLVRLSKTALLYVGLQTHSAFSLTRRAGSRMREDPCGAQQVNRRTDPAPSTTAQSIRHEAGNDVVAHGGGLGLAAPRTARTTDSRQK